MASIIPGAPPGPTMRRYNRGLNQISDGERRAWAKAINAHSAARSSRDRTARTDRARRKKRRRNPPDFRRRSKLYRIYVEMPAHSVRGHAIEGIAPFREEPLQARPRARLHEHLCTLHTGEPRERHRHRIEHGDRGTPLR